MLPWLHSAWECFLENIPTLYIHKSSVTCQRMPDTFGQLQSAHFTSGALCETNVWLSAWNAPDKYYRLITRPSSLSVSVNMQAVSMLHNRAVPSLPIASSPKGLIQTVYHQQSRNGGYN